MLTNLLAVPATEPLTVYGLLASIAAPSLPGALAGVLLVALLYALGRYTPLYSFAFTYVPGISLFRQLPAGVPGAYRLLANLTALGRADGVR